MARSSALEDFDRLALIAIGDLGIGFANFGACVGIVLLCQFKHFGFNFT
jgi:hypothetical protein